MRKIEFRGNDGDDWIYGDLITKGNFNILSEGIMYQILPESIGQYTGLKDKNDLKIFEGDVIAHDGTTKLIEFYEGSFIATCDGYAQSEQSLINFAPCRTFVIIGNVFENKDLCHGRI